MTDESQDAWERELTRMRRRQEWLDYFGTVCIWVLYVAFAVAGIVYGIYREMHIWGID